MKDKRLQAVNLPSKLPPFPSGVMGVTLVENGTPASPEGFKAGATACGIKKSGDLDLALLYSVQDCTAAGVFTKNQVVAAPVIVDRETLLANQTSIRGIAANSGVANACTGKGGIKAARAMQAAAAARFNCHPDQFLVLSTGVIGVPLPIEKVANGIRLASSTLSDEGGSLAAKAIMTTDTRPKHLAVQVTMPEGTITIGGMAKGSGMIHPNMATMLAVITTDAAIPAGLLADLLHKAIDQSFHRISVDGDTSTNDTVLFLANGASGCRLKSENREGSLEQVFAGLAFVCEALAKMIVRDGEGVERFVEVRVTGAAGDAAAKAVAETIATSPLVKTAIAGGDPNWGRILAAAGRAGVAFDQNDLSLWIGNEREESLQMDSRLLLVEKGTPVEYAESEAVSIFSRPEVRIELDLGQGEGKALMWTGDLTHEYIRINADYRT